MVDSTASLYYKESFIRVLPFILIAGLAGCASKPPTKVEPIVVTKTEIKTVTIQKEYTPQIWSSHKVLEETPEMCAVKGKSILKSLGFKSVIKNGSFVYGNFNSNRAIIKCVLVSKKTFVYTAVAGADVKLVEKLRNEIAWKL